MDSSKEPIAVSHSTVTASGQWRLARIELFNWGTFDKYHVIDVSREGLLLTGASGSGKSTVIDAISTVMAPAAKTSYNAAASNGAKRDRGRNYNNYVRGAWGHVSDGSGETTRKFLRSREATWSGILLRFEDGCQHDDMSPAEALRHNPINLMCILFQKRNAVSDDTLKSFYAEVRGDCNLAEMEPYGRGGADMAQFNKDYKDRGGRAWRQHAQFLDRVCSLMHISGPKTLTLLQKTQAAKNIGSLDDLFRRYMLDEPLTFRQADRAVEQFEELENAHKGVVRQREQMEMLAPLDEYDRTYAEQAAAEREASALKAVSTPFSEELILEVVTRELGEMTERENALRADLAECESAYERAKRGYETAEAVLSEKSGVALSSAEKDVLERERSLNAVRNARATLGKAVKDAKAGELPLSLQEYETLKRTVRQNATDEARWIEEREGDRLRVAGEAHSRNERIREIDDELRHLRALKSNIPLKLHEIRRDIARHTGLGLADLPFIGELINVKPAEMEWRGAIERLLRGYARTMLVDKRYISAVSEYLEERHLGLRFQYDGVPEEVDVPAKTLNANSLVRKVDVEVREGHENFTYWVNSQLRKRFDYICVDAPADMALHSHALTRNGQVKAGEHHEKDDRSRIDDRSQWALGSSNDAKIAQLESDRARAEKELVDALSEEKAFRARERQQLLLERLADELEAKSWDELDLSAAEEELGRAQRFYEELLQNDDIRTAQRQRDEAKRAMDEASNQLNEVRVRIETQHEKMAELQEQAELHRARLHDLHEQIGAPTQAQALQLRTQFKRANTHYLDSIQSVYQTQGEVRDRLDKRISKAMQAQQDAKRRSEVIMQKYKDAFKAEGANLTASFDDRDGFIARYRQIKSTGLARYEGEFLKVLTDFSQDQITVIATEIRNAFRDVRDRLEPVNRSLMLSEYAPGIHLQIEVREARSTRVEKFLADLRTITSGSWEADNLESAELRYERTAAVMRRLKSPERADREWRRECLSTPEHMKFIAKEIDGDGDVVNVYSNDEGLSGGQKQKLVFFCLAAALRYQLSDSEAQVPAYGTIVLDEAFDKSDRHFAEEALNIFKAFNFHMVLATPGKLLQTIEGHVGGVTLVTCDDGKHSRLSPVMFE